MPIRRWSAAGKRIVRPSGSTSTLRTLHSIGVLRMNSSRSATGGPRTPRLALGTPSPHQYRRNRPAASERWSPPRCHQAAQQVAAHGPVDDQLHTLMTPPFAVTARPRPRAAKDAFARVRSPHSRVEQEGDDEVTIANISLAWALCPWQARTQFWAPRIVHEPMIDARAVPFSSFDQQIADEAGSTSRSPAKDPPGASAAMSEASARLPPRARVADAWIAPRTTSAPEAP